MASLQTLGFICEETKESDLSSDEIELIFSALISSINEANSDEMTQITINAICDSLRFARTIFKND